MVGEALGLTALFEVSRDSFGYTVSGDFGGGV